MAGDEYLDWGEYPGVRIRFELDTQRGRPVRFVVQLEYRIGDAWEPVARFDHDEEGEHARDITEEGLHMDVYRDGEKYRAVRGFPAVDLRDAPRYCKSYLEEHADSLLRRFEEWYDLRRR